MATKAMNLLIAEDQAASAVLLVRTLARLGHEATVVKDGLDAWRKVREGGFRVLICDWEMPGMDGPEVCRKVRGADLPGYVYIILLTSRDGRDDRLEGLRAGADDFLRKPADAEELRIRLEIAARILAIHEDLARQNAALAEMATTDPLTGAKNRRRFHEDLNAHIELAARACLPLSLIMLDVDHFKSFNDTFGHPAGDVLLRDLARVLEANIRKHDIVCRYGGEEFAILLPSTDAEVSRTVAGRLRSGIESHGWPHRSITASLGVATLDPANPDGIRLVEDADKALYRSKALGRNRAVHAADPADDEPREHGPVAPRAWARRAPDSGFTALARLGRGADVDRTAEIADLELVEGLNDLELLSSLDDPEQIWLLTRWADVTHFHTWRRAQADSRLAARPGDSWVQLRWNEDGPSIHRPRGTARAREPV
ncbi:MAG: diguanylate cyclase [Isosphaeraceae bacterium]